MKDVVLEQHLSRFTFVDATGDRHRSLSFDPHLHYHLELVVMKEGDSVGYADRTNHTIRSGDLFLVFPNQIHYYVDEKPQEYYLFLFTPDSVPEFDALWHDVHPASALFSDYRRHPSLAALVDALIAEASRGEQRNDSVIGGILYAIIGEWFRLAPPVKIEKNAHNSLQLLVRYCAEHYASPLSLAVLEEEMHLNRYYISHLFHDKMKMGFSDYLTCLRISEACKLLSRTDLSIARISDTVGFANIRTFNRSFRHKIGMTPGEFRKSGLREGDLPFFSSRVQDSNENLF